MQTNRFLALGVSLLLAVSTANAAALPAGSTVEGKTLAEWSATWWQWALSYPVSNNPLIDTTGSSAYLGDQGSVFFLAGSFIPGAINRTFSVPSGKYVFFPVLNSWLVEEGSESDMRAVIGASMDIAANLHASVDGTPIPNLTAHREISPLFDVTLPEDNLYGAPAGIYRNAVSDGYWVMLEPLGPGQHVINFGGETLGNAEARFDIALDITYAVPEPATWALTLVSGAIAALRLRARRRTGR